MKFFVIKIFNNITIARIYTRIRMECPDADSLLLSPLSFCINVIRSTTKLPPVSPYIHPSIIESLNIFVPTFSSPPRSQSRNSRRSTVQKRAEQTSGFRGLWKKTSRRTNRKERERERERNIERKNVGGDGGKKTARRVERRTERARKRGESWGLVWPRGRKRERGTSQRGYRWWRIVRQSRRPAAGVDVGDSSGSCGQSEGIVAMATGACVQTCSSQTWHSGALTHLRGRPSLYLNISAARVCAPMECANTCYEHAIRRDNLVYVSRVHAYRRIPLFHCVTSRVHVRIRPLVHPLCARNCVRPSEVEDRTRGLEDRR